MGRVLSFPNGEVVPAGEAKSSDTIEDFQAKKFADSLADDCVIQMIQHLQQEGLKIGTPEGGKTFLDVGIFLEAFRAMIYRDFELPHPFHQITDKMMYIEKVKGRRYSVVNYSGTKIVPIKQKPPTVQFESDMNLDDTD
jgi:hypothetical protein|tara:strand:- start:188 stop:604 length:417 start_codon:yes stop_codon:yes gene_type:complete